MYKISLILIIFSLFSIKLLNAEYFPPRFPNNIDETVKKAKAGDPEACYFAGIICAKGNPKIGKYYLELGLKNGSLDCAAALGQGYETGLFGVTDYKKAYEYYLIGAKKIIHHQCLNWETFTEKDVELKKI